MYIFEHMIDMGLEEGQDWPSPAHRVVACNIALCNSQVNTRDKLTEVCQAIPANRIRKVTLTDVVNEFHVPYFDLK